MKFYYYLIIFFFIFGCSFDKKSGIWQNEKIIIDNDRAIFKDFKNISPATKSYNKTVLNKKNYKFILTKPITTNLWNDIFFNKNNNLSNFRYDDLNQVKKISKKITKEKINKYKIIGNENLIISDQKGNLIIFSLTENRIISKFNFYKKRYKNLKKKINFYTHQNTIIATDNFGFVYAYDYNKEKILWAKNLKIPLRSNIKLVDNKIIFSDQKNNLYFLDKKDGALLKQIPTEETQVNNNFTNNLSINNNKNLLFINSFGSLYFIDLNDFKIKWFKNLNQSLSYNSSNIFTGQPIISFDDKILASSKNNTYVIDEKLGSTIHKFNFSPLIKPIINNDYVFLISKNNFLISFDLLSGNILYSLNIDKEVSKFLNENKQNRLIFRDFMILNNNLFIFLENSFYLKFSVSGELLEIKKLSSKINSKPVVIKNSILYLNNKNKLVVLN